MFLLHSKKVSKIWGVIRKLGKSLSEKYAMQKKILLIIQVWFPFCSSNRGSSPIIYDLSKKDIQM